MPEESKIKMKLWSTKKCEEDLVENYENQMNLVLQIRPKTLHSNIDFELYYNLISFQIRFKQLHNGIIVFPFFFSLIYEDT